jgi:8-hydroxy-5-deazaflavin:NADPH oxidoreductase
VQYAILGAGNVGTAISRAVVAAGHDVIVSDPNDEALSALSEQAPQVRTTTDAASAVDGADVAVLAVPFPVVEELVTGLADALAGTIVIDATNPLAADLSGLVTDGGPAGAERVQAAAPAARVVKAFNTVFAGNQATAEVADVQLDGFIAGDDVEAKQVVGELLGEVGFRTVDVGGLSAARYLEGMAYLNIALNARSDLSWQTGWKLVGPLG